MNDFLEGLFNSKTSVIFSFSSNKLTHKHIKFWLLCSCLCQSLIFYNLQKSTKLCRALNTKAQQGYLMGVMKRAACCRQRVFVFKFE